MGLSLKLRIRAFLHLSDVCRIGLKHVNAEQQGEPDEDQQSCSNGNIATRSGAGLSIPQLLGYVA